MPNGKELLSTSLIFEIAPKEERLVSLVWRAFMRGELEYSFYKHHGAVPEPFAASKLIIQL
jgi:hypothetical protein